MASPVPPSIASRRAAVLVVGLLAVAALAAYRDTFLAPFVLDDTDAITENLSIRHLWPPGGMFSSPSGGATVAGRPVLNFSLAVNYAISGEAVWSYHVLNLVIHFLAACTLFGVVRRTLGLRRDKGQGTRSEGMPDPAIGGVGRVIPNPPLSVFDPSIRRVKDNAPYPADATLLAFAVALLWLLHPLQTESVTYVSQRAESLAGLFYLLTLYCFIRGVEGVGLSSGAGRREQEGGSERQSEWSSTIGGAAQEGRVRSPPALPLAPCPLPLRSAFWFSISILCCLLGMATKEIVATAPLLVFLYDRTFVAGTFRGAWRRRRWLHLSLAAAWVPLALLVAGTGWNRGGTAGFNVGVSPGAYWLTQFEAVARYLQLALWPHPLVFEYGTFWIHSLAEVWWPGVMVLALLGLTVWALGTKPAAGFLGAWFFVILAPTSLVPGTNQMIVEHRMYLSLAAVVTGAVFGLHGLTRTLIAGGTKGPKDEGTRRPVDQRMAAPDGPLVSWSFGLLVLSLAFALGFLTFARNSTYRTDLALWRDTVAKVPRNPRAWYNLGVAYSERGQYAQAVAQDEAALRLAEGGVVAEETPVIENKLGYDLAMLGRMPEAVAHYEQALRLKPDYGRAQLNLARALVRLERYPEAVRHYEAALRLAAGGAETEAELSDALLHEGRADEAVAHCREAVRLAPTWAPGFNNLAYALLLTGRNDEAVAAYREAVRLDPRYAGAWVGLGYALIQAGRPAEAVAPCTEAVKLRPRFADAHNTLGIALAQAGRPAEAIACFEQALRLGPGAADVHNNLGNALAATGRTAEAIDQYREAVRLNPDYAPAQRNLGEELRRAGRAAEAADHLAAAARLEAAGGGPRATPSPSGRAPAGN